MAIKRMLIDTTQEEETRVVIMNGDVLEVIEYDNERNKQTKGNIYLGRISRIEPSLQAVFVDYGANRHGFLSFSEVHPDYYLLSDKERDRLNDLILHNHTPETDEEGNILPKKPLHPSSVYDIYNALKPNQPLIVQVVKEERGNKGAALTTIISISGRYCVFMPNTHNNSGVSRKITNNQDRQRIREILDDMELPFGVSTIIRTAGEERSKQEILRDMKYLVKLWGTICEDSKNQKQIGLIYEEANLIRRAIRDLYTRDIEEILVEGQKGFEQARNFMKVITPSHSKKILEYTNESLPLFHRYQVERQLSLIADPIVQLPSGGSIVISPTEALVAIDVNSGRATKANSVEETALQTNLEATHEIMRQLQLKNLAGLIVIDFIDMLNPNNQKLIEQTVKKLIQEDNAKIQSSKISRFGLLELSRQRLRPSIFETHSEICPHCSGTGYMRSASSSALRIIRAIEEEAIRGISQTITVFASQEAVLYILNEKRSYILDMENTFDIEINLDIDTTKKLDEYYFDRQDNNDMEMDQQENTNHLKPSYLDSHNNNHNQNSNTKHMKPLKDKNFKYNSKKYNSTDSYSKVQQPKELTNTYSNSTYNSSPEQQINLRKGRKKPDYSHSTNDKEDNNFEKKDTISVSEKSVIQEIIKSMQGSDAPTNISTGFSNTSFANTSFPPKNFPTSTLTSESPNNDDTNNHENENENKQEDETATKNIDSNPDTNTENIPTKQPRPKKLAPSKKEINIVNIEEKPDDISTTNKENETDNHTPEPAPTPPTTLIIKQRPGKILNNKPTITPESSDSNTEENQQPLVKQKTERPKRITQPLNNPPKPEGE